MQARRESAAGGDIRWREESGRVFVDRAADYAGLRRRVFGFDLAALPASLRLSAADAEINRAARLAAVMLAPRIASKKMPMIRGRPDSRYRVSRNRRA